MFYVYGTGTRNATYPHNWREVASFQIYEQAVEAAKKECGSGEICTESGDGLPKGFFGKANSKSWSAMITQHDIFERERA